MGASPLFFGMLIAASVLLAFIAMWRLVGHRDPLEERMAQFGVTAELDGAQTARPGTKQALAGAERAIQGLVIGPRIAAALSEGDVPLTVVEFALIVMGVGAVAFTVGYMRGGALLGVLLGAFGAFAPILWVRYRKGKRSDAFTAQLPDVLALLVGGLRAGYGLTQAIAAAREQLMPPASQEFERVMRAVSLGLPVHRALSEMADRVDSDDLGLVVTAISVQHEIGGNLAQTLEIIAETVRDRIKIKREIRVFTAQQRLTGIILALLPVFLGIVLYLLNPEYMSQLFQPGIMRIVLIAAIVMQVMGFLLIRKIVDIEV